MFKKDKVIYLVFLTTIASTSLYIIFKNLPIVIGSFRFFWGPVSLIIIFLSDPDTYLKKPLLGILLYGVIILGILQYSVWIYMTDWTRLGLLEDFFNIFIFTAIFTYLYSNRKYLDWAKIGKMGFIFILITIIGTNIALSLDPLIVRNSAGGGFTPYQESISRIFGTAGYGYAQALVFLIPVIVYHIKMRKALVVNRGILSVILVSIFITLVRAQVFANILVAFVILILSVSGVKRARKSYVPITLVLIILIAIPQSFYANLFLFLSEYFDPSSMTFIKLTDFAAFIQNPELDTTTGAGGRAERYPILFEAFVANPLFGNASIDSMYDIGAGGHLYWMNRLTQWGLLGFLFFVYVLYQLYKKIRSLFDDNFGFYYFLSAFAFILLGLIKNVAGREPFLMLIIIIPGLYFLPMLKFKKTV